MPCNFLTNLEAESEAFGSRSLKFQSTNGFLESNKFERAKGSNIVKCVQRNILVI